MNESLSVLVYNRYISTSHCDFTLCKIPKVTERQNALWRRPGGTRMKYISMVKPEAIGKFSSRIINLVSVREYGKDSEPGDQAFI